MTETVNHPTHYQGCSELTRSIAIQFVSELELYRECIEVIEKYGCGFHVGNALKYLWRCGEKGNPIEDLQKAKWYLDRYESIHPKTWHITIAMIDQKIEELGGNGETKV